MNFSSSESHSPSQTKRAERPRDKWISTSPLLLIIENLAFKTAFSGFRSSEEKP